MNEEKRSLSFHNEGEARSLFSNDPGHDPPLINRNSFGQFDGLFGFRQGGFISSILSMIVREFFEGNQTLDRGEPRIHTRVCIYIFSRE